jgi:diaminopimelate decarboxylase
MDHFEYRAGELFAESVPVAQIAAEFGTPCYVYSRATLELHYDRMSKAFEALRPLICFSVKCCPNVNILKVLAQRGAGMDVVSGGELYRARLAEVPLDKIVFAGVGKTDAEIREALREQSTGQCVGLFNIESEPEFEVIALAARSMGVQAKAALRVNPGIKAGGHEYIATGTTDTKFGVDIRHAKALFEKFAHEKHLRLTGIHVHLGSSILQTEPYVESVRRTLALIDELATVGVHIETLDLGGGFGADYHTGDAPSAEEYAKVLVPLLSERVRKGLKIIFEPGRTIAANAGLLLTRVLYVKLSGSKKFVVCDAGMNTLIRPSLYNAFHFIWPTGVSPQHEPVRRGEDLDMPGLEPADVVGPVCESGDFLAKARKLPTVARGEVLAVYSAGAYGMSMASRYNSHPLPAEVLVEGSRARVIRQRESREDLVRHERV